MSYTKTNWVNDSVPAINATNLNNIEEGIYQAHNILNDISTIPLTINEDYVYSSDLSYICFKIGKMVFLNIRTIAFVQELNNGELLISGLPKPVSHAIFYLYGGNVAMGETVRCGITTEGNMQTHYGGTTVIGNSPNCQFGGFVIYETND